MHICKASVHFPIMKMDIQLDFPLEASTTLQEFKEKIFEGFWQYTHFRTTIDMHGTPDMVVLSDSAFQEIKTDAELRQRIEQSASAVFNTRFKAH